MEVTLVPEQAHVTVMSWEAWLHRCPRASVPCFSSLFLTLHSPPPQGKCLGRAGRPMPCLLPTELVSPGCPGPRKCPLTLFTAWVASPGVSSHLGPLFTPTGLCSAIARPHTGPMRFNEGSLSCRCSRRGPAKSQDCPCDTGDTQQSLAWGVSYLIHKAQVLTTVWPPHLHTDGHLNSTETSSTPRLWETLWGRGDTRASSLALSSVSQKEELGPPL